MLTSRVRPGPMPLSTAHRRVVSQKLWIELQSAAVSSARYPLGGAWFMGSAPWGDAFMGEVARQRNTVGESTHP